MNTRKRLNYRFIACLLVVFAIAGAGVHFAHAFQIKRSAKGLLYQADKAKDNKEQAKQDNDKAKEIEFANKEIDYLYRYLGFVPDDADTLPRYAELVDDQAKRNAPRGTPRRWALIFLEKALRQDDKRNDLRRRAIDAAMDLGGEFYRDAKDHLRLLLESPEYKGENAKAKRAELERLMGLCEARRGNFRPAVGWFEKAIEDAKDQFENYRDAAILYQEQLDQPDLALQKIEDMVNPKSHLEKSLPAWLTRAKFLLRYQAKTDEGLDKAIAAAEKALDLGPQNPEAILLVAELRQVRKKPEQARELLVKAIQANPNEPSLYLKLIALKIGENQLDEAWEVAQEGLKNVPESVDLLHALAELQVLKGELEEADKSIEKLGAAKYPAPLVDYLTARIHIRKGEWGKARPLLEKVTTEFARRPGLEMQVLLLLGQSHEQLGNPDQALLAYLKAQKIDPFSVVAHYRTGTVLMTLRRFSDALAEFNKVREFPNRPRTMHILVARSLIALSWRLPSEDRKQRVKEIKSELDRAEPNSRELPILRAQVILLEDSNKLKEAQQVIESAKEAHPDWVELWVVLAQLATRGSDDLQKAVKILDEGQKKLPDSIELRLARLGYRAAIPPLKKDATQAQREEAVKAALERVRAMEAEETPEVKVKGNNLPSWWGGLADTYVRLGSSDDAKRLWEKIAEKQPNNLAVRLLLFDLALIKGADKDVEEIIKQMQHIEGDAGTFWRYAEASSRVRPMLTARAEKEKKKEELQLSEEDRKELRTARKFLADAAKQRTSWARIPALQAEIDDLEGKKTAAIEKFKEALKQGERRPLIIRRLVQLLYKELPLADAQRESKTMVDNLLGDESALVTAGLGRWVAEALLNKEGDAPGRAADLAAQSVSQDSQSYQDYLWLGRVQWAAGKKEEARASLEKACQLKEGAESPETWVALVAFLADIKSEDKEKAVARAVNAKLPPEKRPMALAACYELVGDLKQAEKYLQETLKLNSEDLSTRYSVAGFYLRYGGGDKAKDHLEYLIQHGKPNSQEVLWARRNSALLLASGSNQTDFDEALRRIDRNLSEAKNANALADQRARALVLATRISRRKQAISLLEKIDESEPLAAALRFTLVQLYVADGKEEEARRHMRALQDAPGGIVADRHAYYARHLLQRGTPGDIAAAAAQLSLIEKAQPESSLTKEIKARVLKAQGRDPLGVLAVVREYAQSPEISRGRAAALLEELSRQKEGDAIHQKNVANTYRQEAEKMYRQNTEKKKPESFLLLAEFLGRRGKISEALDCCEEAYNHKSDAGSVAMIMTAVLREGGTKEECQRVEKRLNDLLSKSPKTPGLLLSLADLYDLQGRFLDTEDLYARVLNEDPKNLWALNNLAWLLVFKKGGDKMEALTAINKALNLAGPSAELLDTRAVIYLELQRAEEAVQDLIKAIDLAPTGSRYFHLARAWKAIADRDQERGAKDPALLKNADEALKEAKRAWKKVVESGLQSTRVHILEREQYSKLRNELALGK